MSKKNDGPNWFLIILIVISFIISPILAIIVLVILGIVLSHDNKEDKYSYKTYEKKNKDYSYSTDVINKTKKKEITQNGKTEDDQEKYISNYIQGYTIDEVKSLKNRLGQTQFFTRRDITGQHLSYIANLILKSDCELINELKDKSKILNETNGINDLAFNIEQFLYMSLLKQRCKEFKISENNLQIYLYLIKHGIRFFYHFTSRYNSSLIKSKGLLPSSRLEELCRNEPTNYSVIFGGNNLSRSIDRKKQLDKKVHLSFCIRTPMLYHNLYNKVNDNNVLNYNPENLILNRSDVNEIDIYAIPVTVILMNGTVFSDKNAAANDAKFIADCNSFENVFNNNVLDTIKKINNGEIKFIHKDTRDFDIQQSEILVDYVPEYLLKNLSLKLNKNLNQSIKYDDLCLMSNKIEEIGKREMFFGCYRKINVLK